MLNNMSRDSQHALQFEDRFKTTTSLPLAEMIEVERALQSGVYARMTLTELRQMAEQLHGCGEVAVEYLFNVLLSDPSGDRRHLAAGILGKIGTSRIVERTWQILESDRIDDRRKLEVLGVLLQIDDYDLDVDRSAECFLNVLALSENVMEMLRSLNGDEENVFLWQSALLEMPAELQEIVVKMLLDSKSPEMLLHLRGAIELQIHSLSLLIARGLRAIECTESIGLLGELQSYPNIEVRRVARESMRVLHSKGVSLQEVFLQANRGYHRLHRVFQYESDGMLAIVVSRWLRSGRLKYGVFLLDEIKRGLHTCFGNAGVTEEEFEEFLKETSKRFDVSRESLEEIELKEARQAIHYGCCVAQENGYQVPATYVLFKELIDRTRASLF